MTPLPEIMVAPNGARRTQADHPALPMRIAEIVASARACHAAGAGALHAHTRDRDGAHVLDAALTRELMDAMARAVPKMPVQITTESAGRYTPAEQRDFVREARPGWISVALREMLSDGEAAPARRFYHDMAAQGVAVQHILHDLDDVRRFVRLMGTGFLPATPPQVLLVLGRYAEGRAASPDDLDAPLAALRELARPPAGWAACAFGPQETRCLAAALAAGGKARVGFENNLHNADGSLARDNAERVHEIAAIVAGHWHDGRAPG